MPLVISELTAVNNFLERRLIKLEATCIEYKTPGSISKWLIYYTIEIVVDPL